MSIMVIEEEVGRLLREKGWTIATAESCTCGLIAGRLANVPGCSDYLMGGAATYSNQAKMDVLGVSEQSLIEHGAVSSRVAIEMARGACKKFKADVGIAVTGIAGPGGATKDKPVGLVWFGLAWPHGDDEPALDYLTAPQD